MARPLRIEYPDAVYHISNYGLDKQRVFPSAKYFDAFLEVLGETCARLNVEVHAYCLLKDQYHLVVKTPESHPVLRQTCMRTIRSNLLYGGCFVRAPERRAIKRKI